LTTNNTTTIYKIENPDFNEFFELHVSKTRKIMESHIKSCLKKEEIYTGVEYFGDTLGLTISGPYEQDQPFAYIFFNEENLSFSIINHEIVHLGMAHERYVLHFKMDYGDEKNDKALMENEERLAYYVTFASNEIYKKLIENKHVKLLNGKSLLTKE
jgi:hypothetical protein